MWGAFHPVVVVPPRAASWRCRIAAVKAANGRTNLASTNTCWISDPVTVGRFWSRNDPRFFTRIGPGFANRSPTLHDVRACVFLGTSPTRHSLPASESDVTPPPAMTRQLRHSLRDHFGFHRFRPGQIEAIGAAMSGRDTLVLMPTGSGKKRLLSAPRPRTRRDDDRCQSAHRADEGSGRPAPRARRRRRGGE